MKTAICILLITFAVTACNSKPTKSSKNSQSVVYIEKDNMILEQILKLYSAEKNIGTADLVVKVGSFFKESPYVGHTLETEPEQLVINLREFDCTTYAESVLAIARTIKSETPSFEQFTRELQNIRYRNGIIDGYPSRLHYFSDWIYENNKRNLVKDISKETANTPYPLHVNFMSTHPASYVQLRDSTLIPIIAGHEKEISSRRMFYIPEDKLKEVENSLQDGDIAGVTTKIEGMDISHVVILVRKEGRIHILHASSSANKVVLSENTLEDYLLNSKMSTGIMVVRPL
jgi:hypothetical protein